MYRTRQTRAQTYPVGLAPTSHVGYLSSILPKTFKIVDTKVGLLSMIWQWGNGRHDDFIKYTNFFTAGL